jgi:hypothetical protein
VLKNRQMSVDITNPTILGFNGDSRIDFRHPGGKYRQLQLWHAFS